MPEEATGSSLRTGELRNSDVCLNNIQIIFKTRGLCLLNPHFAIVSYTVGQYPHTTRCGNNRCTRHAKRCGGTCNRCTRHDTRCGSNRCTRHGTRRGSNRCTRHGTPCGSNRCATASDTQQMLRARARGGRASWLARDTRPIYLAHKISIILATQF